MHVEILENNLFHFAPAAGTTDVVYREMAWTGGTTPNPTDLTDVSMVNGMTMPLTAANIEGDPLLDATWHIMSGSPCIDSGTATEAPPDDFDGDTRPNGSAVDIGPDER